VLRFAPLSDNAGDPTSIGIHDVTTGATNAFLISTLCTTTAIAVLAACSGNMATMPSTNYQLPSRIASNEPAAAPSQVKPMGENGWSQCTDPIWGTFWLQITPSQSDEFIGWYQVISGYVRTCGDDKYDGHVIYNLVKISWANMNLDVKAFWNGKCVGTCGLSANEASSTVEVSHVSPKNSKLLASFDTCSACIITGLAVAKDQTLFAAVEPASSSSASSIYVWSYGSTSPSAILQGQSRLTGVGVAIDASKNVYWTANAPKGSGTTGELWEYPTKPAARMEARLFSRAPPKSPASSDRTRRNDRVQPTVGG
jgi:hypothetical protein